MKLPYGLADFHRIRADEYLYVDRTGFLSVLEELGSALVLLRPRRFGKSLWIQTLRNYYDLRLAGEFDRLFGGLEAGRRPTGLRNRYFILSWDFSEIGARGGVREIGEGLNDYVNSQIRDFLTVYSEHLPVPVRIEKDSTNTLRHLLTAIRQTSYRLYLLIDEYDNFINEIMVRDTDVYRDLVHADGPFKELFKSVKSALQGQGLERVFVTGVSPVALNDVSSGFNVAEDVSLHPELATLCGFTEAEVHEILRRVGEQRSLEPEVVEETLATMRTWYNGYRFSETASEMVYNPTNALYFLKHLYRRGAPPAELQDPNLATDQAKLVFLSQTPAGARVISELTEGDGTIEVFGLETQFSMEDLAKRLDVDRDFLASFLYFLGLLTQTAVPRRLCIPNLVVEKLYLDRLLEAHLPDYEDRSLARMRVLDFFKDGEVTPLLELVEEKLFPVLSSRDYRGMKELVLKALLLSLLFDDRRYVVFSELEAGHGFTDLCLLRRPHARSDASFDVLFELKYVSRRKLGERGRELRGSQEAKLRAHPEVEKAFRAARHQLDHYRRALRQRFGKSMALRSYAVVAVGLERLLGEEVKSA